MSSSTPIWNRVDADCRVAVIGLGLIGGSFAAALRLARPRWSIVGCDRDDAASARAVADGLVDRVTPVASEALKDADVIVLATPVGVILDLVAQLDRLVAREAVVIDVGSTKGLIVDAMSGLSDRLHAIGGHPMTGPLTAGSSLPSGRLFAGTRFVLSPTARTTPSTLDWALRLLSDFGANVVVMDANEHDRAVAVTSHLPYLISLPLLELFAEQDEVTQSLAAGGFQSRVDGVGSSVEMWRDIVQSNRRAIAAAISAYADRLRALERDVLEGSTHVLRDRIDRAVRAAHKVPRPSNRQP